MPSDIAASFCHRLRVDSFPAVWLTLVGRYLQLAGANVGYGPIGANGASPDWQATFPGGHVLYVEATSPEYDPALDRVPANHEPLRAIIDAAIPEGWSYSIRRLPNHGPDDRRVEFKRVVQKMFSDLPPPSTSKAIPPRSPDEGR